MFNKVMHNLNFYFLQWLTIRLGYAYKEDMQDHYEVMTGQVYACTVIQKRRFILIWGACPMSGYDSYKGENLMKTRPWKYFKWNGIFYFGGWQDYRTSHFSVKKP